MIKKFTLLLLGIFVFPIQNSANTHHKAPSKQVKQISKKHNTKKIIGCIALLGTSILAKGLHTLWKHTHSPSPINSDNRRNSRTHSQKEQSATSSASNFSHESRNVDSIHQGKKNTSHPLPEEIELTSPPDKKGWIVLKDIPQRAIPTPIDTTQSFTDKDTQDYIAFFIDTKKKRTLTEDEKAYRPILSEMQDINKKETMQERIEGFRALLGIKLDDDGNTILHYLAQWYVNGEQDGNKNSLAYHKGARASKILFIHNDSILRLIDEKLDIASLPQVYGLQNQRGETFIDILRQDHGCIDQFINAENAKFEGNNQTIMFSWEQGYPHKYTAHSGKEIGTLYINTDYYIIKATKYQVNHSGNCMAETIMTLFFYYLTQEEFLHGLERVENEIIKHRTYNHIIANDIFNKYSNAIEAGKNNFTEVVTAVKILVKKITQQLLSSDYQIEESEKKLLVVFIKDFAILYSLIVKQEVEPSDKALDTKIEEIVNDSKKASWGKNWWISSLQAHSFLYFCLKAVNYTIFTKDEYIEGKQKLNLGASFDKYFILEGKQEGIFIDYLVAKEIKRKF